MVLASAVPGDSRPYFIVPILETLPTWRARSLYLCPPGARWPRYTPGHWVPFPSPLTTRRATVEVVYSASAQKRINSWRKNVVITHRRKNGHMIDLRLEKSKIPLLKESIGDNKQRPSTRTGRDVRFLETQIIATTSIIEGRTVPDSENSIVYRLQRKGRRVN
jgi:hypothetical protein